MRILVTGGAGYIGSHTCLELLQSGHEVVVVDSLSAGKLAAIKTVEQLTGQSVEFHQIDLLDRNGMTRAFETAIDAVIHFAALKVVGESITKPLQYYRNNVSGTIQLLEVMRDHDCRTLVYSSSCNVYGEPKFVPITEEHPTSAAASPYGWTKLMTEQVMRDVHAGDPSWKIALLRYFNPVGAHESGHIGEDPNGVPTNLMPFITQVAIGKQPHLSIFGNDYHTQDGTAVRDFIHVVDLAQAHLAAVEKLKNSQGLHTYNLGTGNGTTVLELVKAFQSATDIEIPCQFAPRRDGDIIVSYADPSKANRELGWQTKRNIEQMCLDSLRWQQQHPNGFDD